jgi:hypothetical protein
LEGLVSNEVAITTIVTLALALGGYLVTYLNNLRLAQRQEQLARVNRQLSDLYGPLFALTQASDQLFEKFKEIYRPLEDLTSKRADPFAEELAVWRLWATTAFAPKNRKLYDIVTANADLLIEDTMPAPLVQLCAHVTAFEITLKQWEESDYSDHLAIIPYPGEGLRTYSRNSFNYLKARQAKLLGHREVRPG